MLQVLFSSYPRGRAGVALLALRLALGATLVTQGVLCLAERSSRADFLSGLAAVLGGALLTLGFLTPIVLSLVALAAAALWFFLVPACMLSLFDARLSIIFGAVILLAVFLLGPGAFSVDSRLFGRREIIIPQSRPSLR